MSPIAHIGIALFGWEAAATRKNIRTLGLFLLAASFPDLDFFLHVILGRRVSGLHQYYTHNLLFVLVATGLLSLLLPSAKDRLGLILTGLSHLALDLIVIDPVRPIGVRLFFPFAREAYNFGFFPNMQRGGVRSVFSQENLKIFLLEGAIFVLPFLVLFGKKTWGYMKSRNFWRG
jgi:membrane-bound metal-dependent hydrolase YbcI (DUF457 family)